MKRNSHIILTRDNIDNQAANEVRKKTTKNIINYSY